jgi:ABC-type glycerol-3-phosphate transport system permease component
MVVSAFKTEADYIFRKFTLPQEIITDNFRLVWTKRHLQFYFRNSLLVVGGAVFIYLFVCSTAAYAFAKLHFPFRLEIFLMVLALTILPQVVILLPLYRLVVFFRLLNKHLGLIIVYVAYFAPFGTYLMTSYYRSIPNEIIEAAKIDGADDWQIYTRIMLPIGKPGLATLAVVGSMAMWKELLFAMVLLQKESNRTLMAGIAALKGETAAKVTTLSAALLISAIPTIAIFLFLQQYLTKGFTTGAIKE